MGETVVPKRVKKHAGGPWPKGMCGNFRGPGRRGTSMAERLRERIDPDWIVDIVVSIAAGDPMVRIIDPKTGMPRLAEVQLHETDDVGVDSPVSKSLLVGDERIAEIIWPSTDERLKAITWIRDTAGWKPATQLEVTAHTPDANVDFSKLSAEELEAYVALCEKLGVGAAALEEGDSDDEEVLDAEYVEKEEA